MGLAVSPPPSIIDLTADQRGWETRRGWTGHMRVAPLADMRQLAIRSAVIVNETVSPPVTPGLGPPSLFLSLQPGAHCFYIHYPSLHSRRPHPQPLAVLTVVLSLLYHNTPSHYWLDSGPCVSLTFSIFSHTSTLISGRRIQHFNMGIHQVRDTLPTTYIGFHGPM